MPFNNRYTYINDDGENAMRQIQYAIPVYEKAVYTVFKDVELPELVFDAKGEIMVNIMFHDEVASDLPNTGNIEG